jgi:hypothetical protein|tara:strand:+ start:508 stop:1230 length:723 start_codon:yes stop_codon:yes gene_type:complete
MLEVTIVGNGPSRKDIDLSAIGHEVWGCNAVYRDTKCCDILFAVDMPMQQEIVESGYYLGNLVAFADIDPLPIELWDMFIPTLPNPTVSRKDTDTHFIIQGDSGATQFLGLTRPELIVTYNYPELKNLFTGMSALGYAMMQGYEKINLIGFDALEGDSSENIYEGSVNYMHKYNADSRVLNAQRSQFIALLEWYYGKGSVYWKNPLDERDEIKYNELPYYESSKEWILGQDWLGDKDGLF